MTRSEYEKAVQELFAQAKNLPAMTAPLWAAVDGAVPRLENMPDDGASATQPASVGMGLFLAANAAFAAMNELAEAVYRLDELDRAKLTGGPEADAPGDAAPRN